MICATECVRNLYENSRELKSGGWGNLARQNFPRLTSTQSPTKKNVEKVSEDRLVRFSRPGMFLIKTSFDKGVTEWPLQHDAATFSPAELGLEVVVVHISKIFFNLISVLGGGFFGANEGEPEESFEQIPRI